MAEKHNVTPVAEIPAINPLEVKADELNMQLQALLDEDSELTERAQEYLQVVENIKVRKSEIRGSVHTLQAVIGMLRGPQTTQEALAQGYEVDVCGPNGITTLKPGEQSDGEGDGNTDGNGESTGK